MKVRADTVADIHRRFAETAGKRAQTRELIAQGRWRDAEPNKDRATSFDARQESARQEIDFQPAVFLSEGARVAMAIARVEVRGDGYVENGTGFMVSPALFLTNHHVLTSMETARNATIYFMDERGEDGERGESFSFSLAPDKLFVSSPEQELDYALVAVGERVRGAKSLSDFGYCPLSNTPDRHRVGMCVNIIQHPQGRPKEVVVRQNTLTWREDEKLYYETDTEKGSSGAPVFNDEWDVVALHHYGAPASRLATPDGTPVNMDVNEGIRISSIFNDLEGRISANTANASMTPAQIELVRAALALAPQAPPGPRLEPRPRPHRENAQNAPPPEPTVMEQNVPDTSSNTNTIIVPLEISVRIAGAAGGGSSESSRQSHALPQLQRRPASGGRAEVARLDRDYSNRNGFNPRFVQGVRLDLDKVAAPSKARIASLLPEFEDEDAPGELKYQNFSVLMDKETKLALLTATNIDGPSYIAIDRKTGEPAGNQPSEGDSWYKDRRIDPSAYADDTFYKEWSHIFDRGHLTRRNDPTWGDTPEVARRANYDTFHFTNCSPQHWQFNQSIKLWQGVERHVLEKGVWETGMTAKLAVLQGPLYEGAENLYAGDQIIPSGYWKIIAWRGKSGKKAIGISIDQTALLSIQRRYSGERPPANAEVDVSEYHTSIREIAGKAGLDFSTLYDIDTFGSALPRPGEAQRRLTSVDQLPLE